MTSAWRDFETRVQLYFSETEGLNLTPKYKLKIGVEDYKHTHRFDFGCDNPPVLVECKRSTFRPRKQNPQAKLDSWKVDILNLSLAPKEYRRIFAVAQFMRESGSLGAYYLKRFRHFIPATVEIWEIDENGPGGCRIHPPL